MNLPQSTAPDSEEVPPVIRKGAARWVWILTLGILGIAGLLFLRQVEPAGQPFFPRCWLYQTTGIQCPGCGATRAVHALLNGRIQEAFRLNGLVVLGLPVVAWLGLRWAVGWGFGRWWPNPLMNPLVLALLAGLVAGFGVGRNLAW
ncbi:MAG: DUF2752 domain-containing protein [Verrucomicrobiota bacterium]